MNEEKVKEHHKKARGHLVDAIQEYHRSIEAMGLDVKPMLLIGSVCNDAVELVDQLTEIAKQRGHLEEF